MTGTAATLTIRGDGLAAVDATVRLTPGSVIRCCSYPDQPPILALADGPVHVAVTVPDPEHVTADDQRSDPVRQRPPQRCKSTCA